MEVIGKGKKLYSILYHKCPRCHEGRLFEGKAYSRHFSRMPARCSACGLHYEQEPSFFTGALYVSYALQVAWFAAVYVALRVLFDPVTEVYISTFLLATVVLLPVTLRLSRSIYINLFFSYDRKHSRP